MSAVNFLRWFIGHWFCNKIIRFFYKSFMGLSVKKSSFQRCSFVINIIFYISHNHFVKKQIAFTSYLN